MLFLDFWAEVAENIGMILERILNVIWLLLCQLVYPIISLTFKVLTLITGSLTDGRYAGTIETIVSRIVLILTIVMTFYIVFEFVKYTVTPDTMTDKEKGAMPLFARIVIAILLLAFVPKIFNLASEFQNIVINKNIIGQVIYPSGTGQDIEGLGRDFSGTLFSAFISVQCNTGETKKDTPACAKAYEDVDQMVANAKHSGFIMRPGLFFGNERIRSAGLLALIVGCFTVYVLFLYCKDVALREIQLVFLQVFSPVAIMSYIGPKKDGLFQKWLKQCTTTYLDIFTRLAALYFMMLMIETLGTKLIYEGTDENNIIVYVFLIIGLMMFLKKLPKLLGELFPSSGAASIGMGFSRKDREGLLGLGSFKKTAAYAAGAIAGGKRAFSNRKALYSDKDKGKLRRFGVTANAMVRSGVEGIKGGKDGKIKDAVRAGQEKAYSYETIVASGGSVLGYDYQPGYYQNVKTNLQVQIDLLKSMSDAKSAVSTSVGNIKFRKNMDTIGATLQSKGDIKAATEWEAEKKEFEKLARKFAIGEIDKTQYETQVETRITNFNTTHGTDLFKTASGAFDTRAMQSLLESDNNSIYNNVATQMEEARKVADTIAKRGDIIYTEIVRDSHGNPIIDPATGKPFTRQAKMPTMDNNGQMFYDDGTAIGKSFAEYIGDFTDHASEAQMNIETSDDYKRAKTNAEGKK